MRKFSYIMSLLVVLSLVLAACSGSGESDEGALGTQTAGQGSSESDTTGIPGSDLEVTEMANATSIPDTGAGAVGTASPAATSSVTETMETQESDSLNATPMVTTTVTGTTAANNATPAATVSPSTTETPMAGGSNLPNTGNMTPIRASDLLEFPIQDMQGETIGNVEDLVIDLNRQCVNYVVVSMDGDNLWQMVPYQAMSVQNAQPDGNSAFRLAVDPMVISGAPGFESNNLPDFNQSGWDANFRSYWMDNLGSQGDGLGTSGTGSTSGTATAVPSTGTGSTGSADATSGSNLMVSCGFLSTGSISGMGTSSTGSMSGTATAVPNTGSGSTGSTSGTATAVPNTGSGSTSSTSGTATAVPNTNMGTQGIGTERSVLASELIGYEVQDDQDQALGEIQDVLIEPVTGRVEYLVVAAGGILGIGERSIPVPVSALSMSTGENVAFHLNMDSDFLSNAPSFDLNNLQDWGTSDWNSQIFNYWNSQGTSSSSGSNSGTSGSGTSSPSN